MPRDLWRWDVSVQQIAKLSTVDRLAAVGLPVPRPTQGEWRPFQEVGERLFRAGFRGVQAPSAARPHALVLGLFRDSEDVPGAVPVRPALTFRRPPAPPTGMRT
jgi:hypothetical protein